MEEARCFAYTVELSWILVQDLFPYTSPYRHTHSPVGFDLAFTFGEQTKAFCVFEV